MDIRELYKIAGGDYDEMVRILKNKSLIQKYVLKFKDNVEYDSLMEAIKEGDRQKSFTMAHGLKGMCQNIGFEDLRRAASDVTECFRPGNRIPSEEELSRYMDILKKSYARTYDAVAEYAQNN